MPFIRINVCSTHPWGPRYHRLHGHEKYGILKLWPCPRGLPLPSPSTLLVILPAPPSNGQEWIWSSIMPGRSSKQLFECCPPWSSWNPFTLSCRPPWILASLQLGRMGVHWDGLKSKCTTSEITERVPNMPAYDAGCGRLSDNALLVKERNALAVTNSYTSIQT